MHGFGLWTIPWQKITRVFNLLTLTVLPGTASLLASRHCEISLVAKPHATEYLLSVCYFGRGFYTVACVGFRGSVFRTAEELKVGRGVEPVDLINRSVPVWGVRSRLCGFLKLLGIAILVTLIAQRDQGPSGAAFVIGALDVEIPGSNPSLSSGVAALCSLMFQCFFSGQMI